MTIFLLGGFLPRAGATLAHVIALPGSRPTVFHCAAVTAATLAVGTLATAFAVGTIPSGHFSPPFFRKKAKVIKAWTDLAA